MMSRRSAVESSEEPWVSEGSFGRSTIESAEMNFLDPRQGFSTERLFAEPAAPHHAARLARALADPTVHIWTRDTVPTELDFERQFDFVSKLPRGSSPDGAEIWLTWTLFLNADPEQPIGYVQATIREPARVTIAYTLGSPYWRKGYASEAITAMLDLVFSRHEVAIAVAEVDTRNSISMAFACALGMRLMGTNRSAGILRRVTYDDHVYAITREDWLTRTH
jgi:[ribosomal protein S5]-alanine N-acetyltransferase